MPFAYAGTRRRRNRDRRRSHGEPQSEGAQASPNGADDKPRSDEPRDASSQRESKGEIAPGVGERDPDAPPVENNS